MKGFSLSFFSVSRQRRGRGIPGVVLVMVSLFCGERLSGQETAAEPAVMAPPAVVEPAAPVVTAAVETGKITSATAKTAVMGAENLKLLEAARTADMAGSFRMKDSVRAKRAAAYRAGTRIFLKKKSADDAKNPAAGNAKSEP